MKQLRLETRITTLVARYLPLISQNHITVSQNHPSAIAILIIRLGVSVEPGQLYFLGCELIPTSDMEISPSIPMLEQPHDSYYDRSQSHTNENQSVMETSISKLCQVFDEICTRPIVNTMLNGITVTHF